MTKSEIRMTKEVPMTNRQSTVGLIEAFMTFELRDYLVIQVSSLVIFAHV